MFFSLHANKGWHALEERVVASFVLSCLLLGWSSGQLHFHLMIIFWNHADRRHRCGVLVACDAYPQ